VAVLLAPLPLPPEPPLLPPLPLPPLPPVLELPPLPPPVTVIGGALLAEAPLDGLVLLLGLPEGAPSLEPPLPEPEGPGVIDCAGPGLPLDAVGFFPPPPPNTSQQTSATTAATTASTTKRRRQ
jgi:hypothetical protein